MTDLHVEQINNSIQISELHPACDENWNRHMHQCHPLITCSATQKLNAHQLVYISAYNIPDQILEFMQCMCSTTHSKCWAESSPGCVSFCLAYTFFLVLLATDHDYESLSSLKRQLLIHKTRPGDAFTCLCKFLIVHVTLSQPGHCKETKYNLACKWICWRKLNFVRFSSCLTVR